MAGDQARDHSGVKRTARCSQCGRRIYLARGRWFHYDADHAAEPEPGTQEKSPPRLGPTFPLRYPRG